MMSLLELATEKQTSFLGGISWLHSEPISPSHLHMFTRVTYYTQLKNLRKQEMMGFYHEWYVGTQFSVHFYPFSKTPNYCNFLLPTIIRVVSWIKTFFGYFHSKSRRGNRFYWRNFDFQPLSHRIVKCLIKHVQFSSYMQL